MKRLNRLWWLARYRVLDKHHDQLRLAAFALANLITVVITLLVVVGAHKQLLSDAPPAQAVINIWIQLAILVISALISYALRPKVEGAKPQEGSIPQVQDGKSIVRIYGTVWIDDSIILAWSTQIPPEPIKKKGKK
ncbi:MAG TPA: hypothetical protein VEY92_12180 [Pseudoxanthomonas sp.]|nr:hypothetical protein [Pseudoxanthomonas sp.]